MFCKLDKQNCTGVSNQVPSACLTETMLIPMQNFNFFCKTKWSDNLYTKCHTLCTIMHTQCQKQIHCFYSGGNRFVTSGVQKSVWQPMHWSILLCTSRCVLFHCWAAAVPIKVCACTSHQLQDRFTCECFLLLVLFALLCQLWDDGIEGWSKERGDAHVNANWGGSRRIRRGRNL